MEEWSRFTHDLAGDRSSWKEERTALTAGLSSTLPNRYSSRIMLFLLFKHINSVKMLDSGVLDYAKVSYHEVGIC